MSILIDIEMNVKSEEESGVGVGRDWAKAPKSILSQSVERSSHYRSILILFKWLFYCHSHSLQHPLHQPILHNRLIQFTLRLSPNLSDCQSSSVSYIDNKADMLELMSWCFQSSLNRFGQFTTGWLDNRPPTRRLLETNKRVWSPP